MLVAPCARGNEQPERDVSALRRLDEIERELCDVTVSACKAAWS
ncbi:Hypothetical protein A7982_02108 [Minicystis rosea]|nr:Hypothetical protein A7982_02108 [Minicystis rosea]